MGAEYLTTTDHDTIRAWVEQRNGKPAVVKAEGNGEHAHGSIEIMFPDFGGSANLEEIGWKHFFQHFDEKNLVFLYQETTASGERSNYCKIVTAKMANEVAGSQTQETQDKVVS
jgi:hypothetical protein